MTEREPNPPVDQSRVEALTMAGLERLEVGEPLDVDILCAGEPDDVVAAVREMLGLLGRAGLTGSDQSDQTFGPYVLLERLGAGNTGVVYRAQSDGGHEVALKILRPGLEQTPRLVERFRREARALQAAEHPGICQLQDAGQVHGVPYLAMDLIDGQPLDQHIRAATRSGGPLELNEVLAWFIQAAEALQAAHAAGVTHRDIKPSNLMLRRNGTVVILDFGLAHLQEDELRLTQTGDRVGSPAYMAPEQVRDGQADTRADIYALGVSLYEALTGRLPFTAATRETLHQRILAGERKTVRQLRPTVPKSVDLVVSTAIELQADRRYETAELLAEDLDRIRHGEPPRAKALPLSTRIIRAIRARPVTTALVGAILIGLATTSWLALRLNAEKRQQAAQTLAARAELLCEAVPSRAVELARDALDLADVLETRSALRNSLAADMQIATFEIGRQATRVCFDSERQSVWIGSADGVLERRRLPGGQRIGPPIDLDGTVRVIRRGERPGHLLIGAGRGVYILDEDSAELQQIREHERGIRWVGERDGQIWSLDVEGTVREGDRRWTRPAPHGGRVPAAFARAGQIVAATKLGVAIFTFDDGWTQWPELRPGGGRSRHFTGILGISPAPQDGILTASTDRRVLRTTPGHPRIQFPHDGDAVGALNIPGTDHTLTWSADSHIRRWSGRGVEMQAFRGHRTAVQDLALDDTRFVSVDTNGSVRVFRMHPAARRYGIKVGDGSVRLHNARVWRLEWRQDRLLCATASGAYLMLLDREAPPGLSKRQASARRWNGDIRDARFAGSDRVISCTLQSVIEADGVAEDVSPRSREDLPGRGDFWTNVVDAPGRGLLTSSLNGKLCLWPESAKEPALLDLETGYLRDLARSPRTGRLLGAGDDGVLYEIDLDAGAVFRRELQVGRLRRLAYHPSEHLLAIACSDGSVAVYAEADVMASGAPIATRDLSGSVTDAGFSPDGLLLFATTKSGEVHIWDWRTGEVRLQLRESPGMFLSGTFSPNGHWFASGSSNGIVRFWPVRDRALAEMMAQRRER